MALTVQDRWSNSAADPVGSPGIPALIRAIGTPANLTFGAVLVLAWLALVNWTGAGPGGWQARLCADPLPGSRSCALAGPIKDQSRIAPVGAATRPAE